MRPLLTDAQWAKIQPPVPPPARTGRPRADDRRTLETIRYVLRADCAWAGLPAELGDDATPHRRLRRWQADGVWERIRRLPVRHERLPEVCHAFLVIACAFVVLEGILG